MGCLIFITVVVCFMLNPVLGLFMMWAFYFMRQKGTL